PLSFRPSFMTTPIVPEDMFTTGGSVPRVFCSIPGLSPWGLGPAYIIHDWLFFVHRCKRIILACGDQHADPPDLGLLCARGERRRSHRATDELDELAPSHCLPRGSGQGVLSVQTITLKISYRCPLWVISGHLHCNKPCPLYPEADIR